MALNIPHFKNKLQQQREALSKDAAENKHASETVELDQTKVGRLSRIDSLQMQAMAKESDRRRSIALVRIERALERIENDEFGYCLECDELIAEARLELDPSIPLCITCAAKAEQSN